MPFNVSDSGGDLEPCPGGSMLGRCFALIDHGTHNREFQGVVQDGTKHEIALGFEVFPEDDEGDTVYRTDGKPFTVWCRYTASLNAKAKLRKHLESWRGRAFTAEELKGLDMERLIGAPVRLQVTINDKGYPNVAGMGSLSKSELKSFGENFPAVNETVVYKVSDGENSVFDTFADWRKALIRECHEWQRSSRPTTAAAVAGGSDDNDDAGDDDLPMF